ncbi:MAG: hypothetical protein Kow0010_04880 [Dehalococcoidia bacterium]
MTATRERQRVVFPKDWNFDLDQDMVDRISDECDPEDVVDEVAAKVAGKPLDEAARLAEGLFAAYGERWMDRTLELGNQYRDRTYETLLAAAEKTGELAFPFIPERFIEIAYLSTQPIYSLPIVQNTRDTFSYRMVFCDTISAIRERCGDELADRLPCRQACLAAARRAFEAHGFDVDVSQDASLVDGEYCQFTIRRR